MRRGQIASEAPGMPVPGRQGKALALDDVRRVMGCASKGVYHTPQTAGRRHAAAIFRARGAMDTWYLALPAAVSPLAKVS